MKKLQLIIIACSIAVGIVGCALQKEAQKSSDETEAINSYTSDNTESAKMAELASEPITKTDPKIHIVQKDESLWVIAKKYGVTVKAITEANILKMPALLKLTRNWQFQKKPMMNNLKNLFNIKNINTLYDEWNTNDIKLRHKLWS